jgi:hypothetical protein
LDELARVEADLERTGLDGEGVESPRHVVVVSLFTLMP